MFLIWGILKLTLCVIIFQDHATSYEKAVFDAVTYLMTPDRDDDVAVNLHSEVLSYLFLAFSS